MATTILVVFFMDAIPELNIDINMTSENNTMKIDANPDVFKNKCDVVITKSIINTVKEKFNLDPGMTNFKNYEFDENYNDFKRNAVNSILHTETANKQIKNGNNTVQSKCENEYASKENRSNLFSLEFPENAPFLVAIFETLSNITAQTCAGTLLSPHWILTAASCVNVLEYLSNNSKNTTNQSQYTVIAEAINPFMDGSAHKVTQVLLYPRNKHSKNPNLAMMRISPGVAVVGLEVWKSTFSEILNARIYGWIYLKNVSDSEAMKSISVPVQLTQNNCNDFIGLPALCISTNEEDKKYMALLGSGGPVLAMQDGRPRVVALTYTDETTPLLAVPVNIHASWINNVLIYTEVFKRSFLF